jgi:hypothetical protein
MAYRALMGFLNKLIFLLLDSYVVPNIQFSTAILV